MPENMAGEPVVSTLNPPGNDDVALQEGVKIGTEAGTPSIPDMSHGEDSELISTLDGGGETPEVDKVIVEKKPEDKGSEEDKGEIVEGEEDRYDKIPRFQELRKERNDFLERAIKAEALLETQRASASGDRVEEKDYKDITTMDDDELRDWQNEDPKGYAANQAKQIYAEAREALRNEFKAESYQDRVNATHLEYAEKNADFVPMLNDGRIAKFINAHPGYDAISAHQALTFDSRIKAIEDSTQVKIDEAVKKVKEEMEKDRLVKREPIPAGTRVGEGVHIQSSSEGEHILKDSKKAGGATMALLQKLRFDRARRATG